MRRSNVKIVGLSKPQFYQQHHNAEAGPSNQPFGKKRGKRGSKKFKKSGAQNLKKNSKPVHLISSATINISSDEEPLIQLVPDRVLPPPEEPRSFVEVARSRTNVLHNKVAAFHPGKKMSLRPTLQPATSSTFIVPPPPKSHTPWPTFQEAMRTADALGVIKTTQTVQNLETPLLQEKRKSPEPPTRDPRKRPRVSPAPLPAVTITNKSKGKQKASWADQVEEEIQLDWGSEDEISPAMFPQRPSLPRDVEMDDFIRDVAGVDNFFAERQVSFNFSKLSLSDNKLQRRMHVDSRTNSLHVLQVVNSKNTILCAETESDKRQHNTIKQVKWLIDSGAAKHFTNNLNDFHSYRELSEDE